MKETPGIARRHRLVSLCTVLVACLWPLLSAAPARRSASLDAGPMYQEFDGVFVFYRPRDPKAYRELLPDVFRMPDDPLVKVFVADYYKMKPGTISPYLEAAVFLLVRYKGKDAWHCVSMPVTSEVARRLGIRLLGFPKVMGDVKFVRGDDEWTGELELKGVPGMSIKLQAEGHVVTEDERRWFDRLADIPSLNIAGGQVTNPMPQAGMSRRNLLDLSRLFPGRIEVRPGRAELRMARELAEDRLRELPPGFGLDPGEIVLAYYLRNAMGFSFGRPPRRRGR